MTAHQFEKHDNTFCSRYRQCLICDGGLSVCTVCRCAEGSLPTECPGTPVSSDTQDRIMAGTIDFKNGNWTQPQET